MYIITQYISGLAKTQEELVGMLQSQTLILHFKRVQPVFFTSFVKSSQTVCVDLSWTEVIVPPPAASPTPRVWLIKLVCCRDLLITGRWWAAHSRCRSIHPSAQSRSSASSLLMTSCLAGSLPSVFPSLLIIPVTPLLLPRPPLG